MQRNGEFARTSRIAVKVDTSQLPNPGEFTASSVVSARYVGIAETIEEGHKCLQSTQQRTADDQS
jgi:hypothetical protein